MAIVQLTTNFFPQGTRVEASVKQLSISSDLSFAGIYVRGKMNPGLKGRTIDLATLRVPVKRLNKVFAKATGQSLERIEDDTHRNFWLDAATAIQYGLVGQIIERSDQIPKSAPVAKA